MILEILWLYKYRYTYKHYVWVWKSPHASLFPAIIIIKSPFYYTKQLFFVWLMIVTLLTSLLLLLLFMCPPYPGFTPKSILSFQRFLKIIHSFIPLLILIFLLISTLSAKEIILFKSPKHLPMLFSTIIYYHSMSARIQAVIKSKYPLLLMKHYKACLNNANTHWIELWGFI